MLFLMFAATVTIPALGVKRDEKYVNISHASSIENINHIIRAHAAVKAIILLLILMICSAVVFIISTSISEWNETYNKNIKPLPRVKDDWVPFTTDELRNMVKKKYYNLYNQYI